MNHLDTLEAVMTAVGELLPRSDALVDSAVAVDCEVIPARHSRAFRSLALVLNHGRDACQGL